MIAITDDLDQQVVSVSYRTAYRALLHIDVPADELLQVLADIGFTIPGFQRTLPVREQQSIGYPELVSALKLVHLTCQERDLIAAKLGYLEFAGDPAPVAP